MDKGITKDQDFGIITVYDPKNPQCKQSEISYKPLENF